MAVIAGIELVNTHKIYQRYGTKGFTVSFSMTSSGPWTEVFSGELEDPRQHPDQWQPLQTFSFNAVYARFVKFEVTSSWDDWGGLQYFNVLLGKLERGHWWQNTKVTHTKKFLSVYYKSYA